MSDDNKTAAIEVAAIYDVLPQGIAQAMKLAHELARSPIVPQDLRDPGSVYLAIDMAGRTGLGLMEILHNMYVVHGRPSWKGSFCLVLVQRARTVDGRLRFRNVRYETREDAKGKSVACRLVAEDCGTKAAVLGPWVTAEMVAAEGWDKPKRSKKTGAVTPSKWTTLWELMIRYRAASFFQRVHCPDIGLGLYAADEVDDGVAAEERAAPPMADVEPLAPPPAGEIVDAEVVDPDIDDRSDQNLILALRDADDPQMLRELRPARDMTPREQEAYNAARARIAAEQRGA